MGEQLNKAGNKDVRIPARQTASLEGLAALARFSQFRGYAKPLLVADDKGGHLATSLDFGEARH